MIPSRMCRLRLIKANDRLAYFHSFFSKLHKVTSDSWASIKYGNHSIFELFVNVFRSSVIFSAFTFGIPTILVFVQRQDEMTPSHEQLPTWTNWICLYGYSLISFIPAIAIWSVINTMFYPSLLGDIVVLVIPTLISAVFICQNAPVSFSWNTSTQLSRRSWIIGTLHLVFFCLLWKLRFYTSSASSSFSSSPNFDFYVLAMTYRPEFCHSVVPKYYPKEEFILHGLWPKFHNGTWPSNCNNEEEALKASTIDQVGTERLDKYWPDLKSKYNNQDGDYSKSLWAHEWTKHGTCTGLSQDVYLSVTLDNYIRTPRKVQNAIRQRISKRELVQAFGGGSKRVVTICNPSSSKETMYLSEIRVCLARDRFGYPTRRRIQCPQSILEQDTCTLDDVFLRGV